MAGQSAEDAFREFENSGTVEIGDANKGAPDTPPASKPRVPRQPKPQTADKPGIEETKGGEEIDTNVDDEDARRAAEAAGEEEDGADDSEEDGEKPSKPRQKASERIRDLNKRLREEQRSRAALEQRFTDLEKRGLQPQNPGSNVAGIGEAPDPRDSDKYPLGHLDERYVKDAIAHGVKIAAAEQADAVLHREQETRQAEQQRQQQQVLMGKVDDLATRGTEQYDDFQEAVIDTGLRGDWRLDQPTFEAAHEAEHGAQILYELSQDKKEAARVAGLSMAGQVKFVDARNAEIAKGKEPRRVPGAGAPPQMQPRGANSRTSIKPDTDNLDDFEKAWANEAKRR